MPYNRARSNFRVRRGVVLAEEGVKPKKGFVETAAGWFGLLSVIAAAAAVVLVPAVVDPDLLATDPRLTTDPS